MSETRSEKKQKPEEQEKTSRTPRWVQVRLFPILIRVLLIVLLAGLSLVVGLMVGYGVIGDGSPQDALKPETWTHIIDLVTQDTE
ncbi:DNA-directed RNA polymerase subunit beta [Jeotgalibacillus haloalkalitolerans]|uniref:DNA-directed RNA polymerase subunit beta n=1 Tax=Jeotgalibacillus haloalkalitolerans TaxID=3104292 RepID=A0ABU5KK13_9BACL|nr:DNA-directed RNA polymerase subunit beta [Jeotgalibacillus sp. HH7-29]MDZ5711266.1 DNA-directed RNA polymerase subunit beta [Jeotgalibacillus sp. HH7-29]